MTLVRSIALVAVVTVAEFYVTVYKVPQLIGAPATIGLLAATSLLGVWLLKLQGRVAWQRFSAALAERRMPHHEVLDGVLIVFGGACLILPGFVTDAIGLALLLAPTRSVARRITERRLARRGYGTLTGTMPRRRQRGPDFDVEGTATEYESEGVSERVRARRDRELRR